MDDFNNRKTDLKNITINQNKLILGAVSNFSYEDYLKLECDPVAAVSILSKVPPEEVRALTLMNKDEFEFAKSDLSFKLLQAGMDAAYAEIREVLGEIVND